MNPKDTESNLIFKAQGETKWKYKSQNGKLILQT